MQVEKIYDEDGKGFTLAFTQDDVERVDPITFFRDQEIAKAKIRDREMLMLEDPFRTALLPDEFFNKQAMKVWEERFAQIQAAPVPESFMKLLESHSKGEQQKLLRDQSITTFQLAAFLCRAGSEHGYLMSIYRAEHHPKDIDFTKVSKLVRLSEAKVYKVGNTPLSDGQLKNLVLNRKSVVAHILDRGDTWHCLFQTERSMRGVEAWKGGQPHLHYISDKWGVPRQDVVKGIKDGRYLSTSVHIAMTDYGPQPSGG